MRAGRIVVIGDEDAVFGLGLLGFPGTAVQDLQEARQAVRESLRDPATALILLTENWAAAGSEIGPEIAPTDVGPQIIEIPSSQPAPRETRLQAEIERILGVSREQ